MKNFLPLSLLMAVVFLCLPAPAAAQFEGTFQELISGVDIPQTSLNQPITAVVAAKKTFGVFWTDKIDKTANMLIVRKNGKRKGGIKTFARGVSYYDGLSPVWDGSAYYVAYDKSDANNSWFINISKLSEKGKALGPPVVPQPEVNDGGYVVSHYPSLAWNGANFGLTYDVHFTDNDGIRFLLLDKSLNAVGEPQSLGQPRSRKELYVRSDGDGFLNCFKEDYAEGGLMMQQFSPAGEKEGPLAKFVDGANGYYTSNTNVIANIGVAAPQDTFGDYAYPPAGAGWIVVYQWFKEGIIGQEGYFGMRAAVLDANLAVRKTLNIGPDSSYSHFPVMTWHKGELWVFWTAFSDETGDQAVFGAKMSPDGRITKGQTLLTESGAYEEYAIGVASDGKSVALVVVRYEPDYWTNTTGTMYVRLMK